jgi:putative multiple sugar transport system substrate-binding protein
MKKVIALILALVLALSMVACGGAKKDDGQKTIGILMPTKEQTIWSIQGERLVAGYQAAGYATEIEFAEDDSARQAMQIENMISKGVDALIVVAVDGAALTDACEKAKEAGIVVIAEDRLITNTKAVDYYVTFDLVKMGELQGQFIADALDLANAAGPFNLEIFSGSPDDPNAKLFYDGAMNILKPYLDNGKLVVKSGQTEFEECATAQWKTETAQSRAENIIASNYADGTNIDAWLCSNDSTALGVENALAANYTGEYPIVTGQDCDKENTKNMIAGKQSMSVFKDTRTLAKQVVKMIGQILNGVDVDVNDTETYNNNVITVPSYLCEPVFADVNNYKELLLDSGYYTEDDLK